MPSLTLRHLPGSFAVCRLAPGTAVPAWAHNSVFSSVTRTEDELSIVCPASAVPADVPAETGWALIKFEGPFDLSAVGVLASVTQPLAAAGISLLALGTFDTDYVLVRDASFAGAQRALTTAGHCVLEA
jgi:hypothetical protein